MPETDPAITPVCTRCGSDAMIPDAFVHVPDMGSAVRLQVGVYRKPDALMMKAPVRTDLRASVCGDCGFVEIEATDPRALWDAYVDRLARQL